MYMPLFVANWSPCLWTFSLMDQVNTVSSTGCWCHWGSPRSSWNTDGHNPFL